MSGLKGESALARTRRALEFCKALCGMDTERKADFNGMTGGINPPVVLSPNEIDEFVKERIRLYVQTWIIPELEQALEKMGRPRPTHTVKAPHALAGCPVHWSVRMKSWVVSDNWGNLSRGRRLYLQEGQTEPLKIPEGISYRKGSKR